MGTLIDDLPSGSNRQGSGPGGNTAGGSVDAAIVTLLSLATSASGVERAQAGTLTSSESAAMTLLTDSAVVISPQSVRLLRQTGLPGFVELTVESTYDDLVDAITALEV